MNQLKYCPSLNAVTGGINATIVMLQLEYWFSKDNTSSFYKFLEPCEDGHYRQGDSWVEELGFSKAEFRSAFSKIGKVYKSKREYDASKDKFEGKFYVSYYDRVKRLTYYLRNDKLIEEMYKLKIEGSTYEKTELPISVDYNQSLLQEKDLSMTNTPYEQIVEEFNRICTHLPAIKCLGHRRKQALDKLWQMVERKLETIKEVFHTVQVSDFLSGRIAGKMWRATFDWVIRLDKFIAIWEGYYARREAGCIQTNKVQGDKRQHISRPPVYRQEVRGATDKWGQKPKKRFNRMLTHNWDYTMLEQMEQEYIENKLQSI